MDIDKIINEYIDKEKQAAPSPFLQNRIMTKIEEDNTPRHINLWQSVAVVASIAVAVASGILIGSSYNTSSQNGVSLVVNDNQIENFIMLTDNANE